MKPPSKAVLSAFKQLVAGGVVWGVIGTLVLTFVPAARAEASFFPTVLYYFFLLVIVATISQAIRKHAADWKTMKAMNEYGFWGRLLGIGIFGSLFALLIYRLLLFAGPYLTGVADPATFDAALLGVFTPYRMLLFPVIGTLTSLVTGYLRAAKTAS